MRRERRSEAQQRRRSSGGAAVSLRRAILVEDDRRGDEQERERERGRSRVAGLAAGFGGWIGLSLPARAGYDARLTPQPPREGGRFLAQNSGCGGWGEFWEDLSW